MNGSLKEGELEDGWNNGMKRLVIGILAHVDSGKTTLSEGMLYRGGELRRLGHVDRGDSFLDTHALERGRGITIFAKQAVLRLPKVECTLLDTPGHVDFSAEMERTLQLLDYAVLVISGIDGVQSHTETLWRLLERRGIPTFLFINKMDLPVAERQALLEQLRRRFGEGCIDFGEPLEVRDEQLAVCEERLLEAFLEAGALTDAQLASAVAARKVFPCFFGSALRLEGIDPLLEGLSRFTLSPKYGERFAAQVFKIGSDEQGARLTYLKLTGGSLRVREELCGGQGAQAWREKINQIRIYSGAKFQTVEQALPGMVCAVTGLTHAHPGEGLGEQAAAPAPLLQPVCTYRVLLPPGTDLPAALRDLRRLEQEDPALHLFWDERLGELHMQLMGEVQLEILQSLIAERFGLAVSFGEGSILYRETIAQPSEGAGHFEPLRHYAEVHLRLEPGERGSGIQLFADCPEALLERGWQRLILSHLAEREPRGVLTGSPVTDLRITLVAGRAHQKHTEGGDFRQAAWRAVRQGLRRAESLLLEPWYRFILTVPAESVGRAMSDLQRMQAEFALPQTEETGDMQLQGSAPAGELRGYQAELTAYTKGRGRLSCTFGGYERCHNAEQVIAQIGYDCDADTENPADSIFCAQGAGYAVRWDEATAQMHVKPERIRALEQPSEPPEPPEPPQMQMRRAADYCARLVEDKELMAIYERTYGAVRRDPRKAFAPTARTVVKKAYDPGTTARTGPEYLLVDGYNILFAWEDLRALAAENIDAARQRLIDLLCSYQGYRQCEVILVFDAYKVKGNPGTVAQVHNISVVYTKEAETADMYIEKVTHRLGQTHRVRVATSDGLEQMIILGHGALRLSANAFREELMQAQKAIRAFLQAHNDRAPRSHVLGQALAELEKQP